MTEKWCEIFKTGKHTSANGQKKEWTVADLDTMVTNYNAEQPAPIVIGHPKTNNPAYGWVSALKREGEKLFASFKDVNEEFKEWVKKGLYKNRSISLYPDFRLRHVGFLGAMPPAVKGLAEYQFSENEDYMEYSMNVDKVSNLENLGGKNSSVSSLPKERKNTVELEELKKQNADFAEQISEKDEQIKDFSEKMTEKDKQIQEYSEKVSEKDLKIAELKAKLGEEQKAKRVAEYEQFAEDLIKKGCITPAQKPYVVDFCEILQSQGEYDFAEGEEKKSVEVFKSMLSTMKQIDFNEIATQANSGAKTTTIDFADGKAIAEAIIAKRAEYEKQGIEKSEGEILDELKKGNN